MNSPPGRVSLWAILGALLVPLIVAGGLLSATWNARDRLDRVQAAIVNNDEPVTLNGQLIPLGRQLSGGLVRGQEGSQNLSWVLTDNDRAQDGLRNGTYSAVVTIPKNFSAAATSAAGDPNKATQATIDLVTSRNSAVADPVLAALVTQAATDTLNRTLTETSLDAIYVGLNEAGDGFRQSADGAGKLADGSTQLANGVEEAASGTWSLADGMAQLAAGGGELAAGGRQLSSGASKLAAGTNELAAGTAALPGQVGQLADGTEQFATGVRQYTGGVTQLNSGVGQLSTGLTLLDQQLAAGQSTDLGALDLLASSATDLSAGAADLATGTQSVATGADQLAAGVNGLDDGLLQYQAGLQQVATDGLLDPVTGNPLCPSAIAAQGPAYCLAFLEGTKAGAGAAVTGLTQAGPNGEPSLLDGSATLATNADLAATGAQQVADGAAELATGAELLGDGIAALVATLSQLPGQQAALAAAVHQMALGASQLAAGSAALDAGSPTLVAGADQLAGGTRQLAGGMTTLNQGVSQLNLGTQQFSAGVTQFSAGVGQYTDGVSQAASGSRQLAAGMDQLNDGTRQIADGNRELADGLAEGAANAPHYTEAQRKNLSTAMARPVTSEGADLESSLVSGPALLLVISLWLGALATFVVLRALGARALQETSSSVRLAARAVLPGAAIGAVQAAAITGIGQAFLDLPGGHAWQSFGVMVLAGVTFAAINQALVAWLGGAGRVVSVALAVLTLAGALISATPSFFTTVHGFLPLTPAITALRAIVSDQAGAGSAVVMLTCWLIAALLAILFRVIRSREVTADRLVAQFA